MKINALMKLLLGIVLIINVAHVAGATTMTVAASDSSAAARTSADYLCDGVNDHVEIQAALDALPETGGEVVLTEGTFRCKMNLAPKTHSTLRGQGDSKTALVFTNSARILVDKEYITLEDFSVSGKGYTINPHGGVITVRASHAALRDIVGTADSSIQGVFYVISESNSGYHQQITDLEFTRCKAIDPGTYGFLMSASEYKTIKNVIFTECEAINCGRYSRYDPWIAGFDLVERNNLENVDIIRCRAEGSWESGFHFEITPSKINVRFIDCVSNNNAQVQKITGAEPAYGSGYLLSKDISCINCTSENNFIGFFCSSGGNTIKQCSDAGSNYGFSIIGTSGLKITSTSLTGEARPVQIRSGTTNLLLDDLKISAGGSTGSNPGINVESSVAQAGSIQVKNSNIMGYRYGVYNSASGKVQIQNVAVSGASTAFVNCAILSSPTPTPTPTPKPTISEPTASVLFTSLPSGAAIYLDGKYVGVTPATIPGITMGTHAVEIKKNGYQPWTKTFQVTEAWAARISSFNPTLNPAVTAKPDLVVTDISWNPANPAPGNAVTLSATIKNQGAAPTPAGVTHGVLFTFDDGAAGPSVWSDTHTAAIAPGSEVTLTANGGSSGATWKAVEGTHTVKAHMDDANRIAESDETNNVRTEQITVTRQEPTPSSTASVLFTSFPSGAAIYLDGKYVGATPVTIPGITMGTHIVEIKKNGYQPWTKTFRVTEVWTTRISSFNPTLDYI